MSPRLLRAAIGGLGLILACGLGATAMAALEVVDPVSLCDRYDRKDDEQKCVKFVNDKKPDTYVASACDALDDHKLFMQCLEFATKAEVDPRVLEGYAHEEFTDQERWSCLKKTAEQKKSSPFQRVPANLTPKKK